MSDESKGIALLIEDDAESFFRFFYLAINTNAPELDITNIDKKFTHEHFFYSQNEYDALSKNEKTKLTENLNLMYAAITKYRGYAFKPIREFLTQITKSKLKTKEEEDILFNTYKELVKPYITELNKTPNEPNKKTINILTRDGFTDLKNNADNINNVFNYDLISPDDNDIYEFEKNYNKENPTNQITILKQSSSGHELELFKNLNGDVNLPTNDNNPTFVIFRSYGNGNYKLVVTIEEKRVCKRYKLTTGRGWCALPEYYKNSLLNELNKLKTAKPAQSTVIEKIVKYISNGKPYGNPDAASAEELNAEIGSQTDASSDVPSGSNYSDTSEHLRGVLFNTLITLPSFDDSLKQKVSKTVISICDDQELKGEMEDKTPSKTGLLGGGNTRPSKKKRSRVINKRTKKRERTR